MDPQFGLTLPAHFSYFDWMKSVPPTWVEVGWLRNEWDGLFMVKGVSGVDDAKRIVDIGTTTISVSNHGGNNLDGTPAPIRILSSIANALGTDIEIVMDRGVRRGSDVVKALALGPPCGHGRSRVLVGTCRDWRARSRKRS